MSIQSIRKIVKVGSSDGVTLSPKVLKQNNLKRGDEVEVFIRPVQKQTSESDQAVITAARKVLDDYKQDFQNLANR